MHVLVDPHQLAARGLTLTHVRAALESARPSAGGHVLHKANAEFLVSIRPPAASAEEDRQRLGELLIAAPDGRTIRLSEIARVRSGTAPRRGMFEKDGSEAVAGIVHLRYGHNPLEVTEALKRKLREVVAGLPEGVRLVPCYDRSPLILGAVSTVTGTLVESIVITTLCVLFILRHFRASFVVSLTLPLAALGAFLGLWVLRAAGGADVQTNIMSIAGIVVSIGVLVDSSIVLAENCLHRLHERFGDAPVSGDVRDTITAACRTVGPPAFFAILIMLVSFLPVFALSGIDGQMYRPLAWTKSLALVGVAVLSITLVPAACSVLLRGRVRAETANGFVRTVISVYRPVLDSLLDHPWPLALVLGGTLVLAAAATGSDIALRIVTAACLMLLPLIFRRAFAAICAGAGLLLLSLAAGSFVTPIGRELRMPLDEGMVMDMPITVPRASIAQSTDDLKARNMVLCRFPEVAMVTGKAGRAETAFDPAPLDMIETMVEFRPKAYWPKRRLLPRDAGPHVRSLLKALSSAGLIDVPKAPEAIVTEVVDSGLVRYDAIQREVAWQRTQPFLVDLGRDLPAGLARQVVARLATAGELKRPLLDSEAAGLGTAVDPFDAKLLALGPSEVNVGPALPALFAALSERDLFRQGPEHALAQISRSGWWWSALPSTDLEADLAGALQRLYARRWLSHVDELNGELLRRAPTIWTQVACDEILSRVPIADADLVEVRRQVLGARYSRGRSTEHHGDGHTVLPPFSKLPIIDPHPKYDAIVREHIARMSGTLLLWPHDSRSLTVFGGEMDRSVQMPGWTNVWTRPIQNRVDMLATGVNSEVGVRVMGRNLNDVVDASEAIAAVLKTLPGAANVVSDPVRGKGLVEIVPDPARAAEAGVTLGDLARTVEAASGGHVVPADGFEWQPVRLKLDVDAADEHGLRRLPLSRPTGTPLPLDHVAEVWVTEGPATIKSENGWMRNYVRLNVPGQSASEFVRQARRVVAAQVALAEGVFVEWTGQFEHAERTERRLWQIAPVVLGLIVLILFLTYRDWADTVLMVLTAPAALAGGILCQWLLGFPFSVAVGVGYIACFGMAAATGIVMLVYLREAVSRAGGLEQITLPQLREAVLTGAVHRLRPKLLTEITTVLSLAPMLWSTGVGSDVIRPMAAPVLGGILIADEVIDLLIPVLFYHVRRRRWQRIHATPSTPVPSRNIES